MKTQNEALQTENTKLKEQLQAVNVQISETKQKDTALEDKTVGSKDLYQCFPAILITASEIEEMKIQIQTLTEKLATTEQELIERFLSKFENCF